MSTIGVYDWDYMHYNHVIPNLECAKIYTYYHNRHEIAVLTSLFDPSKYTKFFIRKEYNDGIYPKELFNSNCIYGGRVFNPIKYSPLPPEIERVIPDMHLYEKFSTKFGKTGIDKGRIKHLLNCAHIRLSTDEVTPLSLNQLKRIINTSRYTGIIFHDYDLARVKNSYDIVYELSQTRSFVTKKGINPYAIATKFPIQVNNDDDLLKWLKVTAMPDFFNLQYNGIMNDETLYMLCSENKRMARQIYYKIDEPWINEKIFLNQFLPKIFAQTLFLRKEGIKILLKYDDDKIITQELRNFIDLLNCWLSFGYNFELKRGLESLYRYCYINKKFCYERFFILHKEVTIQEARESFQYIRENNYELFKALYELDSVHYEGGKIICDWL